MQSKKAVKWAASVTLLTLALVVISSGTGATPLAQEPQYVPTVPCGDSASCSMAGNAFSVQNSGTGAAIYGRNTSTVSGAGVYGRSTQGAGVRAQSNSSNGLFASSYNTAGVRGKSTWGVGVKGESTNNDGVYGISEQGYGVNAQSTNSDAIYVTSAGDDGVHVHSASNDGLAVNSAGSDGVQVSYATDNGVYVYSAGAVGMFVANSVGHGFDVYDAGDNGVQVTHAADNGVYANTDQTNNEWGFYTPDKIYAGTTLATGGPLMLVAQNGDATDLEPGDVVAADGLGAPLADSPFPTTLVRRADSATGHAVVGVVYARFVAEEKVEEFEHEGQVQRHTYFETHSTEGSVAPGEYLLYVVLGTCPVKVDAASGPIQPGDLLTASPTPGQAAAAGPNPATGTMLGKALESLAEGQGLIWVLVDLQ